MAKKKTTVPKVKGGATAKAELVAKATYRRKRITTEVIPPDVTRAKTSAWLDLISPMTEWAGLKGDQIRQKRELLRIQREDVLEKIGLRARSLIGQPSEPVQTIPTKFVVPFLEKASLEDLDSELIDTWANLLAAAAANFDPHMVRFCSILSEIGTAEVQFLHRLCRDSRSPIKELGMIEDAPMLFSIGELTSNMNHLIDISKTLQENIDKVVEQQEMPGGLILVFGVDDRVADESADLSHDLDDRSWEPSISCFKVWD
jgi:hypothetical protein